MDDTSLRLMVVDDQPDCGRPLAMILERRGHAVQYCHSGAEALQQLDAFQPDAMLVDLAMPGMSGYDVGSAVRQTHPDLPLIAVTGCTMNEDRARAYRAGFDHFFPKPPNFEMLYQLLEKVRRVPLAREI